MSSDCLCTPPEIVDSAKAATKNLLPVKSRERYEINYDKFMKWRTSNKIQSFSENVLLAYFEQLSITMKPSTLWATYSMLKSTISINHDINIASYSKLQALLKRKSDGFKSKKSKVLNSQQINTFLKNAPDRKYLLMKVILIFGICGACRRQEIRNIKTEDVENTGKSFIVKIVESKTKTSRSFVISDEFYPICKKYLSLRPSGGDTNKLPFFLNYINEKCTKQPVGINKIGSVPKNIAEFLGLPNKELYTGHCLRRSSATILVDAGGDLLALKRHGGWKSSTIAEGYVDDSLKNKEDNASKITNAINIFNKSETSANVYPARNIDSILANCNKKSGETSVFNDSETINVDQSVNNDSIIVNCNKENANPSLTFNNCTVTINNYYKEM
ncbi:unnamed protein product [Brassicogethes aeneus]|uniref:Tyr recombinase domain-containing protein n=1 Tax=Brassicogethes aeneus TaxID=1431903 RepID=A0A9P0FGJ7_BRAAE|nr:unnamed protein product [Brassicogethes aeneus]